MGCFKPKIPKTTSRAPSHEEEETVFTPIYQNPSPRNVKEEILLQIPGCKVHLMDEGEAIELVNGDFRLIQVSDNNISLATIIRVGDDLQWPLTKDEPVVKLDAKDYLFTLPVKDGDPLSYGVTFLEHKKGSASSSLELLDSFLTEHSCFSGSERASSKRVSNGIDWKEFAPRIEDYNNVLAKAIAGGTGQIVRGIFKCSNAYTNQVHKGGEIILEEKNRATKISEGNNRNGAKKNGINKNLTRVRKLSKMTEKLSKAMLDGVGVATGSVMRPVVNSKPGKAFFSMVPGEVLLASLDAVNKILDSAEAAEKQALSATSLAATRMVSERFGESAGEATGEVLATAGHCAGTAWNVFKIRKALYPSSSVTSGIVRNAGKNGTKR